MKSFTSIVILSLLSSGCGSGQFGLGAQDDEHCDPSAAPSRTISCVEVFHPAGGAGFGADRYPDVIYGEPYGEGTEGGSTDVLSLGKGGEIVVGFGGNAIVDGDGPDFIVFENAFFVGSDPTKPFAELGEVSVSEDGTNFVTFPCAKDAYPFEGCAGWRPVFANGELGVSSTDPDLAGGDPFDLSAIGLKKARFVRIRDVSNAGAAPSAGFDLDAAAIVNADVP